MKRVVVVCDNTMGIAGKEIDDGLAILYLMGLEDVCVEAICCTHGNSTTENTYEATKLLVKELGLDVAVLRGADAGNDLPSEAARYLVEVSRASKPPLLLSLGAQTDLAAAKRLDSKCLSRFEAVALMGGIRHTLLVGGRVMDELNFSVDPSAACEVFAAARSGARILLADALNCLPLTFWTEEFSKRLVQTRYRHSAVLEAYCLPWMEHARSAWNTDGFVGWDVLAAIALVRPDLVGFEPFQISCNPRLFELGYLEDASAPELAQLAAPISLVTIPQPQALCEHAYQAWEAALR